MCPQALEMDSHDVPGKLPPHYPGIPRFVSFSWILPEAPYSGSQSPRETLYIQIWLRRFWNGPSPGDFFRCLWLLVDKKESACHYLLTGFSNGCKEEPRQGWLEGRAGSTNSDTFPFLLTQDLQEADGNQAQEGSRNKVRPREAQRLSLSPCS